MALDSWIRFEVGQLVVVGSILIFGYTIGWIAQRGRLRDRDQRIAALESSTREQARQLARKRSESDEGTGADLGLMLPMVVRELNRADLDPRRIPRLIIQLAETLFQPHCALLYTVEHESGRTELQLAARHRLNDLPRGLERLEFGSGRIGWVARHRRDMLPDDWAAQERLEQRPIATDHPMLDFEMIAPLTHYTPGGERVLGVLCVGATQRKIRDARSMLQLITNLGTLALTNAGSFAELRNRAEKDGLTGLTNKQQFKFQVAAKLLHAERDARPLTLFMFDVDHFKHYNDTHGHQAGDVLLRALADLVRENVRPEDLCGRYGGEEFVVAMPDTDAASAAVVADRIRDEIARHPFAHAAEQPGGALTVSGGLAVFPTGGSSLDELIEHADQALYRSKRAGRNRISLYREVGLGDLSDDDALSADLGIGRAPDEIDHPDGSEALAAALAEIEDEPDEAHEDDPGFEPGDP